MLIGIMPCISYLADIVDNSGMSLFSKAHGNLQKAWMNRTRGCTEVWLPHLLAVHWVDLLLSLDRFRNNDKECSSSRQMRWRCKLESHLQSHFGITSCLDKQHSLSLSSSWQVATVNACIRDQSEQITVEPHMALQEAVRAPAEHRLKLGPLPILR